jgi:hypothetical protein
MNAKRLVWVAGLVCVVLCYRTLNVYAVARSVSAPKASIRQVLNVALRAPYKFATPHQTAWSRLKFTIVPSVSACGQPDCNYLVPKTFNNPNCVGGQAGPRCPNCDSGPCTLYNCDQTTTKKSYCYLLDNTNPSCTGCQNADQKNCTVPLCNPNCPP